MKNKALINELKEYLFYDGSLSKEDKERLLNLDYNSLSPFAKTVYDYFYSHLSEEGQPISLNQFLESCDCDKDYYKKVDKEFTTHLFKMQKPLFFFDVDNTLTNWGVLSKEKIDFIKNFDQKNRIILTTGKTYDSIKDVVDACELHQNYASCINGSILVENDEFTILEGIGAISEEIVSHFENAPFDTVVYYPDNIRILRPLREKTLKYLKKYNETYFEEEKIDFSKVVKVLFFIYEGEDDYEKMVQEVVKNYPDFVCMRTAEHTYEILKKTQHKGNTVKAITKLLGRHYRATIGVGDSMNDGQLLSHVGRPYVVSTASDELKSFGYDILEENRNVDIVNLIKHYVKGETDEQ
ncbi:MAG: HAD family phosphatase [Clostridia bacterium]|nr:HAD family phosphatase [Clostridia bacterium]